MKTITQHVGSYRSNEAFSFRFKKDYREWFHPRDTTPLLESVADFKYFKELHGPNRSKTTEIYIRVTLKT